MTPHPTRIVRLQLIGTLLGVSIPFAVESLVIKYSLAMLLATAGFLFTSLNFFHGKVVTLEDDDYNNALTDRPLVALLDYVLNLLVVLSFVYMAFHLDKPTHLIAANLIVRLIDIPLVLLILNVASKAEVIKANKFWLCFNISTIVLLGVIGRLFYDTESYQLIVSATFLAIIIIDIALDYTLNRGLYFSMANQWDDLAHFWDTMQGDEGDIFRRSIIIPAVKSKLGNVQGRRILDAGCGNGCVARALVRAGAIVTGIDKSAAHLKFAESYDVPGIGYKQIDLDGPTLKIANEPFDAAVACFTLQDCKDIQQPLRILAENLNAEGLIVIIRDNDESFEHIEHHSTKRRWLSSAKYNGRGRRLLLFWPPESIRIARGGSLGSEDEEIACEWQTGFRTITRYWNDQSYVEAAGKVGFRFVSSDERLQVDENVRVPQTVHLARYRKRPRLGCLVLKKAEIVSSEGEQRV